ncbi:MAG: hypothetical protein A3E01_18550 [Gammaproteobacteria bacterium RIFCSPHIGHO2_12_FULL_63_22]|nr:MAG: hypothetical protein A3E01_18550 [Gammaproteobacteria bacterium RIFCSPHIGHO2_12_FULL_63_22]
MILGDAFEFFDDEQVAFASMGAPVSAPAPALATSAPAAGRARTAPKKQSRFDDPCRGYVPSLYSEKMVRFAHDVAEKIIAKKKTGTSAPKDPLSVPRTPDPGAVRKRDLKILRARIAELERDKKADGSEILELRELVRHLECTIQRQERELAAFRARTAMMSAEIVRLNARTAFLETEAKREVAGLRDENAALRGELAERKELSARALPRLGVGVAIGLVTTFLVPDDDPVAKFLGYLMGALLAGSAVVELLD